MIHIRVKMPRYAKKKSYRRKRRYSAKKRSYSKKPRYGRYRKTYRKKATASSNPFRAAAATMRRQYAHYIAQSNTGPFTVPQGVTVTFGDQVQAMQFRNYRLDTFASLDTVINKFNSLYQFYRMRHVWVELTPKWNDVPNYLGNQCGEVAIIPLHKPEEIYRSGQSNVGFGGTFPLVFEPDIERWMTVPGAKRFKVVKGQPVRMKIPLTVFDLVLDNPNIGTAGFTMEAAPRKARWLPVMDIAGASGPTLSSTKHFGFAIMFYGWDTSADNTQFDFVFRQWLDIEYKTLNVWPILGDYGSEKKDSEILHVEEPWEEEETKEEVPPQEPVLKRAFTNLNLSSPMTINLSPSPQAAAGARQKPGSRA